jgi:hypothetical protein
VVGGDVEHTPSGTCDEHYHGAARAFFLLAFLMSMDGVIRNDGTAHKFHESPIGVECKVLLKLGG